VSCVKSGTMTAGDCGRRTCNYLIIHETSDRRATVHRLNGRPYDDLTIRALFQHHHHHHHPPLPPPAGERMQAAGGKVDTGGRRLPRLGHVARKKYPEVDGMRRARARARAKEQPWRKSRRKSGLCGRGEADHPVQLVQPTSELSRCTCSIFPWICRLMAVADNVGPIVFPPPAPPPPPPLPFSLFSPSLWRPSPFRCRAAFLPPNTIATRISPFGGSRARRV